MLKTNKLNGDPGRIRTGGLLLRRHEHKTDYGMNISTPVWGGDNLLFISSAYDGGSRMLRLTRQEGKTNVDELWFTNRMRVHFGNAIRLGDYVYGSSGDFGPAFLVAVDVRTGQVLWQDRSFARASLVFADGKLIVLDEDGSLSLVTVSPTGAKVLARAEVLSRNAWDTADAYRHATLYPRPQNNSCTGSEISANKIGSRERAISSPPL